MLSTPYRGRWLPTGWRRGHGRCRCGCGVGLWRTSPRSVPLPSAHARRTSPWRWRRIPTCSPRRAAGGWAPHRGALAGLGRPGPSGARRVGRGPHARAAEGECPMSALSLLSPSAATDAAWLAAADVADVAAQLQVRYRLVGGIAITLLTHHYG